MPPSFRHPSADWVFLGALTLLCAALTALQYRWTGALAHTEETRILAALKQEAEAWGQAFDLELAGSCARLRPDGAEVTTRGREAAHAARLRAWLADGSPRPIFQRLAVAVPTELGVDLLLLDQQTGKLTPAPWPAEWSALQAHLARGARQPGGGGPYRDPVGNLLEFPVFDGPPPEIEWMIFDLDLDYLRHTWLPELTRVELASGTPGLHEVEVRTGDPAAPPLYASAPAGQTPEGSAQTVSVRFNQRGRPEGRNARPPGWTLLVQPRPGALEQVVADYRRRNLAVAGVLNALILVAGGLLVRHTRRARGLAEAQMRFVANVSHELRTPLTVIQGAAHNLQRGIVHERTRVAEYGGLILAQTRQLGEMVEQVIAFAAARRRRLPVVRQPVILAELLREVVAATASEATAAGCKVGLEVPADLPAVSGDPVSLGRVFRNLLTNAAKHGGSGGWIGVRAASLNGNNGHHPPTVEVSVADRGPGIPVEEQAAVFEPFTRGTSALARQVRGSGIGLSLAREIVEAHGGRLDVRSFRQGDGGEPGATFTVRLPSTDPTST